MLLFRRMSTSHRCEGPQIYNMPTDIHLWKQVFEGLVTYSKVKRMNRGYMTRYTIKLTLKDQDYSNRDYTRDKVYYCLKKNYYGKIYLHFIGMGGLELLRAIG